MALGVALGSLALGFSGTLERMSIGIATQLPSTAPASEGAAS